MKKLCDSWNKHICIVLYCICFVWQSRRRNLEEAREYYHFCHECDNLEAWMKDKVGQCYCGLRRSAVIIYQHIVVHILAVKMLKCMCISMYTLNLGQNGVPLSVNYIIGKQGSILFLVALVCSMFSLYLSFLPTLESGNCLLVTLIIFPFPCNYIKVLLTSSKQHIRWQSTREPLAFPVSTRTTLSVTQWR